MKPEHTPNNFLSRPLISIITVCYNSRDSLIKTITSIKSLTYTNFEYIVVDGGSNDGSIEVIRASNQIISKWISEPDRGIYHAMNKGLMMASGEYIHYLNAGDTFLHNEILSQVVTLLYQKPKILMNQVLALDPISKRHQVLPRSFGHQSARDLFHSAYCHQAAFVYRDAYLQFGGFDESFSHFADFKALCMIKRSSSNCCIENPLPIVEFPLDGMTSDWRRAPKMFKEKERLLKLFGEEKGFINYNLGILRAHLYKIKMQIKQY
jgi:glycosyltransferase involved in cell wall biosynthesis